MHRFDYYPYFPVTYEFIPVPVTNDKNLFAVDIQTNLQLPMVLESRNDDNPEERSR